MTDAQPFDWGQWKTGELAPLEQHSEVKLNVLRDYIKRYIDILCRNTFGSRAFKLTLVDGFAGGGMYKDGKAGSPLVILKAVQEAEAHVNNFGARHNPIAIDAHFYFVEQDPTAFACLTHQIEQSEFTDRIGKTVFLLQGEFQKHCTFIVAKTQERHRRGGQRVIFFLDQCGYTGVQPNLIRWLSEQLDHKAEFIINVAIRWLTHHLEDSIKCKSVISNMGLSDVLNLDELLTIKNEKRVHWSYLIESKIGPAFWEKTGMPFFSPFYIEPEGSDRGYWLLHLAPHARARSAMADVHWDNANGSIHYGHAGLNMLAYKADSDPTGYLEGMRFNDVTRQQSKQLLHVDVARQIHDKFADGLSVKELLAVNSNGTIANEELFLEVVRDLVVDNEIVISGQSGGAKRSTTVSVEDFVRPCRQLFLFGKKKQTQSRFN